MQSDRERALILAHDAGPKDGTVTPEAAVSRARVYLDFLRDARGGEISDAARAFANAVQSPYLKWTVRMTLRHWVSFGVGFGADRHPKSLTYLQMAGLLHDAD